MKTKLILLGLWLVLFNGCAGNPRNKDTPFTEGGTLPDKAEFGVQEEKDTRETFVYGINKYLKGLRNSIKSVVRRDDSSDSSGKSFSEAEVESVLFDSYRVLNHFLTMEVPNFPQQHHSSIGVGILESLQEGFQKTIEIRNGYAVVIDSNVEANKVAMANTPPDSRVAVGKGSAEQAAFHDVLVAIPLTKGVQNEFVGYSNASNTEIEYFKTEPPRKLDLDKEERESRSFVNKLVQQVVKEGRRVISVSYGFEEKQWENINCYIAGESANCLGKRTQESVSSLSQNRDKYTLLVALENKPVDGEPEPYSNENLRRKLKVFQEKLPNAIFVSTCSYNNDANDYDYKRTHLAEDNIEFFTVLGDYTISLTHPYFNKLKLEAIEKATSFATPVLAQVVFNMQSLNPWLSSYQVKDILIKSADNYNHENTKTVGHVVNSKRAYEFGVGALLANFQSHFYSCENASIRVDNQGIWTVDCKVRTSPVTVNISEMNSEETPNFGENDFNHRYNESVAGFPFAEFYQEADIYTASSRANDKAMLSKKTVAEIQVNSGKNPPQQIVIKDIQVSYYESEVRVTFTKEFSADGYQDVTEKVVRIDYSDEKGIPRLREENVVKVVNEPPLLDFLPPPRRK